MTELYTKSKAWSLAGQKAPVSEKYDKFSKTKSYSENNLLVSNSSAAVWLTSFSYSLNNYSLTKF